jgi:hypothetical protein
MAKAYRNADGTHIDKPSDQAMCVGTQAVSYLYLIRASV